MSRAAIQGVRGAFSHAAAIQALGGDVALLECRCFEELLAAVVGGAADHGVVPVENTLAGSVQRNMDLIAEHDVHVVAETRVRVRLCVAARPGVVLGDVGSVASHPVALEQCRGFFAAHPRIACRAAFDTAGSVRDLMAGTADHDAAIASELAAETYGANVLARDLEDDARNFTRFLIVRRGGVEDGPLGDKTSLVFETLHRPGALQAVLAVLAQHAVNVTRLQSRPIPGRPWEYRFHADVVGPTQPRQAEAIAALEGVVEEVRILGTYFEEGVETRG